MQPILRVIVRGLDDPVCTPGSRAGFRQFGKFP